MVVGAELSWVIYGHESCPLGLGTGGRGSHADRTCEIIVCVEFPGLSNAMD